MREIKFRGRHIVTGAWVYGQLLAPNIIGKVSEVDNNDGRGYHPEIQEFCIVDRESVGQYTGIKDKNGVEIYEGDIVKTVLGDHVWHFIIRHHEGSGSNLFKDTAYRNFTGGGDYEDTVWGDFIVDERSNNPLHCDRFSEIIGNIYENPELLNG